MARILHLSTADPTSYKTGADVRTNNVREQLDRDHNVTSITFADGVDEELLADDVEAIPAPRWRPLLLLHPRYLAITISHLRNESYDVVYIANVTAAIYGIFALLLADAFTIFDDHNVTYRLKLDVGSYLQAVVFYLLERYLCSRVDLLVTVSEADQEWFDPWVRNQSLVVRNGFDAETYRPDGPTRDFDHPVVLFFGALWYAPNREAVGHIVEDIAPAIESEPLEFHIVGPGSEHVRSMTATSPNVETVGYVPDLAAYIRSVDVVIVPLQDGGGTRLKIIESLACGTPVISTPIGAAGWPSTLPLLRVCSLDRFPAQILECLEKNGASPEYAEAVKEYTWEQQVSKLTTIIDAR